MDSIHYEEMVRNLDRLTKERIIQGRTIYLFGHCNATEELADLLLDRGFFIAAILDNNALKHGDNYRGISIKAPQEILKEEAEGRNAIVCIVARAYAAMVAQLEHLGYKGVVRKLVDYNSFADYSLSDETRSRMTLRRQRGSILFSELRKKYPGQFLFLCPFSALGDIYIMMSYLPHYMKKRGIKNCVVGVVGNACAQVVRLFGTYMVEIFSQKNIDETIQAALYEQDENFFIPHQDRPYVVKLYKALYSKKIPLEQMYCCGIFGLPQNTRPYEPINYTDYSELETIEDGHAVIFSSYAKSVTSFSDAFWERMVAHYTERGYQCFTNVAGDEKSLAGTIGISPRISEMKSVVERAGTYVGIRSGLCDVIRSVKARKIALYPDYNYSDTKWKAIDIYALDGWENIVIKGEREWEKK